MSSTLIAVIKVLLTAKFIIYIIKMMEKQAKNYRTVVNRLRLGRTEFQLVDEMSFLSKNLYNSTLYETKQHYLQTGGFLPYVGAYHVVKTNQNYQLLPSQVAQQTMKVVERSMKSFFGLLRARKNGNYNRHVKLPKYLDKEKGRFVLIFTPAHIKITNCVVRLTVNKVLLKKYNLRALEVPLPKHLVGEEIKEIRVNPRLGWYDAEFVYVDKTEYKKVIKSKNTLAIDLGVNNLASMLSTNNPQPLLIDGREIKSKNRWINKEIAKASSTAKKVNNKSKSKKSQELFQYRNNYLKNKFHHISNYIINYCLENRISQIVIGYNKEWKQNINIGRSNNQNFVQIPHGKLVSMIEYKAKNHKIEVTLQEESYTSKCDSLALEKIQNHQTYLGKRVKRGLFQSSKGVLINSDINGAVNILRKCKGDASVKKIVNSGCVSQPVKIRV